ncbi:SusC/RagA family TonB-linked outer membrane protein [Runella zeae]|uniref:SusC/RagA family TonB-linked outer membrane protein n=1 Tax=Runella zeae TaxID=94255 RepID=UPI002353C034|nr:TonB-dependent receptor [Runella zeae]
MLKLLSSFLAPKHQILTILLCLWSGVLLAKDIKITGIVTDNGIGVPGVTVKVKGTATGTLTDVEGKYSITADENATLTFSFIGFNTVEENIANRTQINVNLTAASQVLDEVIVVGYGSQRKRDLTGSIGKVKGEELFKQPVQTATQALQGKVAGVQIIASGQPNTQPQVRIRGIGSALAGVNPLYVVDGVLTDDIRNINNNDIVSLEVLKDASASIYGVRAANGVILITTKKGKAGEIKVNYDGNTGFRQAANLVKMANRDQYLDYLKEIAPTFNAAASPHAFAGTTDWYDAVLRRGQQQNHNISVSGGSEKSTFYISGGYIVDNGIVTTNDFRRITFRINNDYNISKRLKLTTQLSYTRGNEKGVELGDTYRSVYRASPMVIAKDENGKYGNTSAFGNVGNPLLSMDTRNDRTQTSRFQGNVALEYTPIEWLKLRTAFSADNGFSNNRVYLTPFQTDLNTYITSGGNQRRLNSQLNLTENRFLRWIADNTATFAKSFGKHDVTLLVGSITEKFTTNQITGSRINVPVNEDLWYLGLGNPDSQLSNGSTGDLQTRQSFVGRLNYNFDGKYLLTASLRRDGSSKFVQRWGNFPTIGAGWVLSEESFIKNTLPFLDFLKLRGSWGKVGNDNIESAAYILTAGVNVPYYFGSTIAYGSVIQDIKDQNLRWEASEQADIGFEFTALNNRLSGEMDYYNKKVNDALAYRIIPAIFGDPDNQLLTNVASFVNKGIELSLNWKDKIGKGFNYTFGGNISFNKNQLLGLNGGQALLAGSVGQQGLVTRTDNGREVGSFYVLNAIGVFQNQAEIDASPVFGTRANVKPGDLKYQDVDGNNVIDANDKIYAGSYQPKAYYGFNLGLDFKGFDFSTDFYGSYGGKIYNGKRAFRFENTDNLEAAYADARWKADRPSNTDPRIINSATPASTYFIESGDFIRLNNLTLGYSIPKGLLNKAKIERCRVYFVAQNLFTISKFSGFSPELPAGPLESGIELNTYPTTRTIAVGLNLGF